VLVLRPDPSHELLMKTGALQILNDGPDADGFEAFDHAIRAFAAEHGLQLYADAD
jgi:hypothetical protein